MSSIEFRCRHCDTLLKVKVADQEKLIRCPQCQQLQRYVDQQAFRPIEQDGGYQPSFTQVPQESWSLLTADGQEYHGLDRSQFEAMLRQGHLDTAAYFMGGEYRRWTPVAQLFQSGTRPSVANVPASNVPVSGGPAFRGSVSSAGQTYPSSVPGMVPPRLEDQLPLGFGNWILALGLISIPTACVPIAGPIGILLAIVDLIRIGNGDVSNRQITRTVIGLMLCFLSLFLACQCRVRL